jgi:hypothetical protein
MQQRTVDVPAADLDAVRSLLNERMRLRQKIQQR